jgi:hypothetical protein
VGVYKLTASGTLTTPRTVYTSMKAGNTTPGPVGIPDLYWWFDASDSSTITASGGKISQWRDKSSTGLVTNQANASLQPTYTTAGQNGLNVVTFNGGQYLTGTVSVTANQWTHLSVYRWFSAGASGSTTYGRLISLYQPGGTDYGDTNGYETHLSEQAWGGVNPPLVGGYRNASPIASITISKDVTYMYHCTLNGGAYTIQNGTSAGMTSASGSTSTTSMNASRTTLGAGMDAGGGDAYVNGFFCESVFYKRVLTSTELGTLRSYFTAKWGV